MDLKNLFSKNKDTAPGEAKTIKDYLNIIIIVTVVCIFILLYFFLIKPIFTEQESMIKDKYYKLSETKTMNSQINALENKVEELEIVREEKFKLFVSEQEVEELYQLISFSALRNQLKVIKLTRGEEEAIRESAADTGADIATLPVDYYKIFVEYDIEGKFPNYLKLKEEIAELDKLIVFEKEEVKTTESRNIIASVKISLVRMPAR